METNSEWKKFEKNPVAYFCAEFALVDKMPSYAGGLGILAGDYVLEAADQKFPLIGIGLFYQKGQNSRDQIGEPDGRRFGLRLVRAGWRRKKILIPIPIENRIVYAQVWQWRRKNNSVYFLDTNIRENTEQDRLITEQLYVEDREFRLKQELVLGVGGVRLLKFLNISPAVYHLNEGHSALLLLELTGEEIKTGLNFSDAFNKIKRRTVFTNHTLVLEGQEMFAFDSLIRNTERLCTELKLDIREIIEKGKTKSTDSLFSMTTLALNGSRLTNAVSRIHGEKARGLWPGFSIIHITNGIYLPRWDKIKGNDIVAQHQKNEEALLKIIRQTRGDDWKKEALLIGWSRRFVPYKRPLALLEEVTKLKKILETSQGKIHIVYSAPLDCADTERNEFLNKIERLMSGELSGYLTFIPHYRIEVAEILTAGCDVWLNTPMVGREACGTSGMKAALNGTLAVSTNDGWIAESPLNDFGWLIDDQNITTDLMKKLENEIIPAYAEFQKNHKKSRWWKSMQQARSLIIDRFSTKRMLSEYIQKLYKSTDESGNQLINKKLIAFDVDGTIAKSRESIDSEMSNLLKQLLEKKRVAIITGGAFEDIKKQVLDRLPTDSNLKNLYLLPTNGGCLMTFSDAWEKNCAQTLTLGEKKEIISTIEEIDQADPKLRSDRCFGQKIQDRESQITYSALGESAPAELKYAWDPDLKKRSRIQKLLQEKLPDFEVKIGGKTSIDITPKGMDKAYAIMEIIKHLKINKEDVLFFGDAIYEGGNDYPVEQAGYETIKVSGPEETKKTINEIIS